MSNEKSKKKKDNNIDKTKLWNIFESEINTSPNNQLECLYRTISQRENCEMCTANLAFSEDGFLTCTNNKCGIVYKDILDQGAEWRYYGVDDNQHSDPTRCGMPINPLLQESSFGCRISCTGGSSYEMKKIRRYTEWQSMPYKEKAQYDEFQRITICAQNAGISKKIIDDALWFHKKISEYEQSFRGDNKEGILIGAISMSCEVNGYPRTAKELAAIFNADVTVATKGCKTVRTILNELEKDNLNNEKTIFCKAKPEDFIERYCSKLNINNELTKLCQFIALKIIKKNYMPENTPHSIAAGIVYFISQLCKLNVSKREVKNISEISEVTINKCFKKLEKIMEELIPPVIIKKYNIQIQINNNSTTVLTLTK